MLKLKFALSAALIAAGIAGAATPVAAMPAGEWRPATLGATAPVRGQSITFQNRRGAAFGSDGCNRFNRAFREFGRNGVRFTQGASTMMACVQPRAERASRAFNRALDQTRSWRMRGDRLYLLDARGRQLASFKR